MSLETMVYGLPVPPSAPSAKVVQWRRSQLIGAGLADPLAMELAQTEDLDLHALLGLVEQGLPPRLAATVLEPISGSSH